MTFGNMKKVFMLWFGVLLLVSFAPACNDTGDETTSETKTVQCGDRVCVQGLVCDDIHGLCVDPLQFAVCASRPDGSECSVYGQGGFVCDHEVCIPSLCGDGIVDAALGEECDDGTANSDEPDALCRTSCRLAGCGDGVLDTGEECDAGDGNSDTLADACRKSCRLAACGDGVVDSGEECDDGNTQSGDGCSADCRSTEYCGNGIVDPGEECDDGNIRDWDGCNTCTISEFQVNTYTADDQEHPAVAMAPDGRIVVVWQSYSQDGSNYGVYGQLYGPDGSPVGGEFQVNTYTAHSQSNPAVAMAPDGRIVVAWASHGQDNSYDGIFARRYDASGRPVGSEFQVNTYFMNNQTRPSVAMGPDGSFVVAWLSYNQEGHDSGIYAQRFTPGGSRDGHEFRVNTDTEHGKGQPNVAMGPDGRFVVVWTSNAQDGDGYGVYGQLYGPDGSPVGGEFQVNTSTDGYQGVGRVAMASDGSFVVVWMDFGRDGDGFGIFGRRYDASGSPLSDEIQMNSVGEGDQHIPRISMAPDGRFAVVWYTETWDDGDFGYNVFARLFAPDGTPDGEEFQVNVYTGDPQVSPDVVMGPDGRLVVVWKSYADYPYTFGQDGDGSGIFAQRFTPDGTPLGLLPWP